MRSVSSLRSETSQLRVRLHTLRLRGVWADDLQQLLGLLDEAEGHLGQAERRLRYVALRLAAIEP